MTQVKKISAIILISLISLIIPQGLHAQTPIPESAPPAKEAAPPKVKTSNVTPNPPEKSASKATPTAQPSPTEKSLTNPTQIQPEAIQSAKKAESPGFLYYFEKHLSSFIAFITFIVIFAQSWLLYKTTKLQANTTQLSQVKLQLETILRGSAVPLGQQALSVGYSDHADMIQKRKDFIITQICGEDATEEKKAWVTTLVNQWFELEKKLSV